MSICNRDHRNDQMFDVLPESQAYGDGRHRCAGCAYDQGYEDGANGVEPNFRPDELDFSQAGIVRHKSPAAAYNMGYADGLRSRNQPQAQPIYKTP